MKHFALSHTLTVVALLYGILAGPSTRVAWANGQSVAATVNTAQATTYTIASEDVLSVTVVNFSNLSVPQVVVAPDGSISLPLLGQVSVVGLTTDDTARLLARKWRTYVINPSVTVSLMQKHPQTVVLAGHVGRPGPISYRPNLHVLEAIASGGDSLSDGNLAGVVVTHKDGTKQPLDLSHPETKAGTDADPVMQDGDTVYVPEQRAEFSVIGAVNHPGSYIYKNDMTVLDALTTVGGVREDGDLNRATLTHNGRDAKLNLEGLLRQGDMSQNVRLSAGDRLMVPEGNRTYVYGDVARPGYYSYTPGDRVLDALNAAGGPLQQNGVTGPDLAKVNLIRIDASHNNAVVQQVNLEQFLKKGDMSGNVPLRPGDVLYIPDKRRGFQFTDVFGVLEGLNLVNLGAHIASHGLGN